MSLFNNFVKPRSKNPSANYTTGMDPYTLAYQMKRRWIPCCENYSSPTEPVEVPKEYKTDDSNDIDEQIRIVLAKLRMKPDEKTKKELAKKLSRLQKISKSMGEDQPEDSNEKEEE